MKYNMSIIMKRAWNIKRKNKKNIFSICLKISWYEFKKQIKDKLVNDMLNQFCAKVRPKWYRSNMTTNSIISVLSKNNIEIPEDISTLLL